MSTILHCEQYLLNVLMALDNTQPPECRCPFVLGSEAPTPRQDPGGHSQGCLGGISLWMHPPLSLEADRTVKGDFSLS